jgi:hypothetical protein
MNFLSDCINYVRRIIKSPSNATVSDSLIVDYINRFGIEIDLRLQLFDLKKKYSFQTVPGVDRYNMPLYSIQTEVGAQEIAPFPVYQGFMGPAYVNGIQVTFSTQRNEFFNIWPNVTQYATVVGQGDGSSGPYTITLPVLPNNSTPINPPVNGILRGHIDIQGITQLGLTYGDPPVVSSLQAETTPGTIELVPVTSVDSAFYLTSTDSTGANVIVQDSGQFLSGNVNYGLMMQEGRAPYGNAALSGGYSTTLNTINYFTGEATVTFPVAIPSGVNINAQYYFFQSGLPRALLYYNNTITLRTVPSSTFRVELDAYLTPAAFMLTTDAVPFAYMTEYWARGAARKMLADTGDMEQFQFYEPLFKEQEALVWKRSQRQFTSTRTQTIYSQGQNQGQGGFNNFGGLTF